MIKKLRSAREMYPDLSKRDYKDLTEKLLEMVKGIPLHPGTEISSYMVNDIPVEKLHINDHFDKIIFYIHGGAFVLGSPEGGRFMASHIAALIKANVVSVDYRLAEKHPFPAALDDCVACYKDLLSKGVDPKNIVFLGESAGGNLALSTALFLKQNDIPLPAGICSLSPAVDLSFSLPSYKERINREIIINANADEEVKMHYVRGADPTNPLISPLFGEFTGFPPVSIHVGTEEMLFDDSVLLAEKLEAQGIDVSLRTWEEMFHAFQMVALPESFQSLEEIAEFYNQLF
ncbi:alpha/beta hydrolase [Alkalihalobacillus sp. 1P02AB]|uniref:alpha/beta hydrolase n=1 Tax=Alkalihalobacillus sp. 1P02AB TaxID=3132260 RepID=UPI0039A61673